MKRILLSSLAVILFAASAVAQTDGTASKPSDSSNTKGSTTQATGTNKHAATAQASSAASSAATAAPTAPAATSPAAAPSSGSSSAASGTVASSAAGTSPAAASTATATPPPQISENQSPLSFRIGGADFSPLGFLDFTTVFRSTDVGTGIGTTFNAIPFNAATPQGELTELRMSAQNSRLGLKVDANPGNFNLVGYVEADFLGSAPTNLEVTSHSDAFRMRLYWVDIHKGKVEILAGQSWSMMTPNRIGISPMPADIFYSQDMDTNYQVGLVWVRTPGFRVIFHPNEHAAWGFALEDPEQYTAGLVTYPTGFNDAQVDDNGSSGGTKTPNKIPDIISKLAFDTHPNGGGRNLHFEIAGLYRAFRLNTGATNTNVTTSAGGGSINLNLELVKNFHLIANSFWSDGGGRYIFGDGPDLTVDVNGAGNFAPSPVHADSGIGGFEWTINKSLIYAYYGAAYYGRDFIATTNPVTLAVTYTGYGYPGSQSGDNRTIQEPTIGLIQTFWKNRNYGDLKLITQVSYLSRNPWSNDVTGSNPAGASSAHLGMAYVDLRYDLP